MYFALLCPAYCFAAFNSIVTLIWWIIQPFHVLFAGSARIKRIGRERLWIICETTDRIWLNGMFCWYWKLRGELNFVSYRLNVKVTSCGTPFELYRFPWKRFVIWKSYKLSTYIGNEFITFLDTVNYRVWSRTIIFLYLQRDVTDYWHSFLSIVGKNSYLFI
jgi:hypothetical protein